MIIPLRIDENFLDRFRVIDYVLPKWETPTQVALKLCKLKPMDFTAITDFSTMDEHKGFYIKLEERRTGAIVEIKSRFFIGPCDETRTTEYFDQFK